jgi:carbonic anhydrase
MLTAREALERLKKGNREFASSMHGGVLKEPPRLTELPQKQDPFAIILCCSDARVPAEIVFNQRLGDLFVIRVAGNIVAPSQVGSVEYAVARYDAPLIMVLGHSHCGGILSTIEAIQNPGEKASPDLLSIVDRVRPSVEGLLKTDLRNDMDALVDRAVRANVAVSVNHLRHNSELVAEMIAKRGFAVVGAEYSLETGEVELLDTAGAE